MGALWRWRPRAPLRTQRSPIRLERSLTRPQQMAGRSRWELPVTSLWTQCFDLATDQMNVTYIPTLVKEIVLNLPSVLTCVWIRILGVRFNAMLQNISCWIHIKILVMSIMSDIVFQYFVLINVHGWLSGQQTLKAHKLECNCSEVQSGWQMGSVLWWDYMVHLTTWFVHLSTVLSLMDITPYWFCRCFNQLLFVPPSNSLLYQ